MHMYIYIYICTCKQILPFVKHLNNHYCVHGLSTLIPLGRYDINRKVLIRRM